MRRRRLEDQDARQEHLIERMTALEHRIERQQRETDELVTLVAGQAERPAGGNDLEARVAQLEQVARKTPPAAASAASAAAAAGRTVPAPPAPAAVVDEALAARVDALERAALPRDRVEERLAQLEKALDERWTGVNERLEALRNEITEGTMRALAAAEEQLAARLDEWALRIAAVTAREEETAAAATAAGSRADEARAAAAAAAAKADEAVAAATAGAAKADDAVA